MIDKNLERLIDIINGKILFKESFVISDISKFDFNNFLDKIIKKIIEFREYRNGYNMCNYEIVFFRGDFLDYDILGSIISGNFTLTGNPNRIKGKFMKRCFEIFDEIKEDYIENPCLVNVSIGIIGYTDKFK
ncbi:MAG: hypothetical protein QXW97_02815 [Candidatus Pacearchaeota archaeon]